MDNQQKRQTYKAITDEEWEAQQIRDEQGRLTHTPEGEPLEVPLSGKVRFRPRVKSLGQCPPPPPDTTTGTQPMQPETTSSLPSNLTPDERELLEGVARRQGWDVVNRCWRRILAEAEQVGML